MRKLKLTKAKREILSDFFTNIAAGFIGSVFIFPGIFGIQSIADVIALLFINIPSGILALVIAFYIKEYRNA